MAATNPFTKNFDAIDKGTHDPSAPQENPFTPKQKQSSNPFTQNFGAIDETYRPRTLGENLGDIGRLWLQGQAGLGGNIGYGLQKTGIAPELGAKLRASGAAETKRLGANLTPQMQEAQAEPLINPEYKQGTEGGQSWLNPNFGLRSLAANVVPSAPSSLAMGIAGSPVAGLATKGLGALGVGQKLAPMLSRTPLAGEALDVAGGNINKFIGSGLGFGSTEGVLSGTQNADQWGTEQRAIKTDDFAKGNQDNPLWQQALQDNNNDQEAAKEALISKGENDILLDTSLKTGALSAVTGGGVPGMIKRGAHPLSSAVQDSAAKTIAKGMGTEFAQEAPQSFYEQKTTNQATKDYVNPQQDVNAGTWNAGLVGGISSGVMGAFGGAGSAIVGPLTRARNQEPGQTQAELDAQAALNAQAAAQLGAANVNLGGTQAETGEAINPAPIITGPTGQYNANASTQPSGDHALGQGASISDRTILQGEQQIPGYDNADAEHGQTAGKTNQGLGAGQATEEQHLTPPAPAATINPTEKPNGSAKKQETPKTTEVLEPTAPKPEPLGATTFTATHELDDGTPVIKQADGSYLDADNGEWSADNNATALKPTAQTTTNEAPAKPTGKTTPTESEKQRTGPPVTSTQSVSEETPAQPTGKAPGVAELSSISGLKGVSALPQGLTNSVGFYTKLIGDSNRINAGKKQINNLINIMDSSLPGTSRSIQPTTDKLTSDVTGRDSKNLAHITKSPAFIKQGFSGLDIPSKRFVLHAMRVAIHDNEVADNIIKLIPVDVMDYLESQQFSSDMLLHNESMLKDSNSVNTNAAIPSFVNTAITTLINNLALSTTKQVGTSKTPTKVDGKSDITSGTINGRHDVTPSSDISLGGGVAETTLSPSIIPQNPIKPTPTQPAPKAEAPIAETPAQLTKQEKLNATLEQKRKDKQATDKESLTVQPTAKEAEDLFTQDWFNHLTGENPIENSKTETIAKEKEQQDISNKNNIITALKDHATKELAQADIWKAKDYKPNKHQVELLGDGPSHNETMSIGSINEGRKRKNIAYHEGNAKTLSDMVKAIESGNITIDFIRSELTRIEKLVDGENFMSPKGLTRSENIERLFSEIVLKDKYQSSGVNSVSHKIIEALSKTTAQPTAKAKPVKSESELNKAPEAKPQAQPEAPIAKTYHPAIKSLANDLTEGGGVSVLSDGSRTSSTNPDWFKNGAFVTLNTKGNPEKSSVKEIKTAVTRHELKLPLTAKQERILQGLSDVAHAEEEAGNRGYPENFDHERNLIALDLEDKLDSGAITLDDIETALDEFDDSIPFDVKGNELSTQQLDDFFGISDEQASPTRRTALPEGEALTGYTEAELRNQERAAKERAKQAAEAELKAKQKASADKEIGTIADEALGNIGTNDLFGGSPLDDLGKAEQPVKAEDKPTKPEWHIEIPEQGLPILPAETKGEGYRTIAGRIAKDAVDALTQNQKLANDQLYLYYLPATEERNGIARFFPDDQTPSKPWELADSQGIRTSSFTNEQLISKASEALKNARLIGWGETKPPESKPEATSKKPSLGNYVQPKGTGSKEQQMALAQRAGRIATLQGINDAVRKNNPDAAYTDAEIQNATEDKIDAGRDWLIAHQKAEAKPKAAALYSKATPTENITTTGNKPDDFVLINGRKEWGEINPEVAKTIRRQAGKIVLNVGLHNPANDTGYGLKHINDKHLKEIQGLGFATPEEFINNVLHNATELWRANAGKLLLVAKSDRNTVMYIELQPGKDNNKDFYRINSAFPVRQDNYAEKKRFESLLKGSEPLFIASDKQYSIVAFPDNKTGTGRLNATESDVTTIAQRQKNITSSTTQQVKSWLTGQKRLGVLLNSGNLRVVSNTTQLPDGVIDRAEKGSILTNNGKVQGLYDPKTKTMYIMSDAVNKATYEGVVAHEMMHYVLDTNPKLRAIVDSFNDDFQSRFNNAAKGIGSKVELSAYKAVIAAGTKLENQQEEFLAHIIEQWQNSPKSFTETLAKVIKDFLARIRIALLTNGLSFGYVRSLTPSDLLALTRYAQVKTNLVTAPQWSGQTALADGFYSKSYSDKDKRTAIDLYLNGATLTEAGNSIGASNPTVSAWLKQAGIPTRSISEAKGVNPIKLDEAIKLYEEGKSSTDIAKSTGISATVILRTIKNRGIPIKTQLDYLGLSPVDKNKAIEMYASGLSSIEISKKLGVVKQTILNWVSSSGLQIRTNAESHGITEDKINQAIELYKTGISLKEVGKNIGVDATTVHRWVKEAGIDRNLSQAQSIRAEDGRSNQGGIKSVVKTRFGDLRSDSMYESARIIQLSKNPEVISLERYKGSIEYGDGKHYNPDFFITMEDGTKIVEEIKSHRQTQRDPRVIEKADAARAKLGDLATYHIVTEHDIDFGINENNPELQFNNESDRNRFKAALVSARRSKLQETVMAAKIRAEGMPMFSKSGGLESSRENNEIRYSIRSDVEEAATKIRNNADIRTVTEGTSQAWDGLVRATAPQYRSDAAMEVARQINEIKGVLEVQKIHFQADMNKAIVEQSENLTMAQKARDLLEKGMTIAADKAFVGKPKEQNYGFMQAIDSEDKSFFVDHPELQPIADVISKMYADKAAQVQALGTGVLKNLRENYFKHLWKPRGATDEQTQRTIISSLSKRPLEGSKGFTKQRIYQDFNAGLAAGLEPISDNPLDIVALSMNEMDKYIAAHTVLNQMKKDGMKVFVRNGQKAQEGFVPIDDRYGTVWGPGIVKGEEHIDKAMYEGLSQVAKDMGIKHERVVNAGRGKLGYSVQGAESIVTQHNTETSVLAHEIGHQIDAHHGLWQRIVKEAEGLGKRGIPTKAANMKARATIAKELRAIADEVAERGPKKYTRKRPEQVAQMVEIYAHAPELMKMIAPNTFKAFDALVRSTPELQGMAKIAPGIKTVKLAYEKKLGGPVLMGRYYVPEAVGQVINNYLSQSLYYNKYVGNIFKGYMGAANMLNQFQLGVFSAFHAGFTSLEAVISHAALGIKSLTEGNYKDAAHYLKTAPMAWLNNPKMGNNIVQEMLNQGSHPEMAAIIEGLQMAGFKWQMDNRFRTDSTRKMLDKWAEGNKAGAALHSLNAIVEQSARPILEWLVPRQKFGVFGEMYNKWMKENPNATHEELRNSAQQIWNRVDSRLGQVVYDRLFMHNVNKNFMQMLLRAPGWTGGTILEVGGGMKDLTAYVKDLAMGKHPKGLTDRAAYTLSLVLVSVLINATLTAMFTGEPPEEWQDLIAFKTGNVDEQGNPERFVLPTYLKDIYGYAEQGIPTTLVHKAHPLLSMLGDITSNRNYYGTKVYNEEDNILQKMGDIAGFTIKTFIPFWMQGVAKEQERGGSIASQLAPLIGVMPSPSSLNKTDAQKLMQEYGADRLPQGARTQEEQDKADLRRKIYVALRKGDRTEAYQLFKTEGRKAGLMPADYVRIMGKARVEPLINSFKSLTWDQAQRVWDKASDEEKAKLKPWYLKKKLSAMRMENYQAGAAQ
jgi:hypothetical protein